MQQMRYAILYFQPSFQGFTGDFLVACYSIHHCFEYRFVFGYPWFISALSMKNQPPTKSLQPTPGGAGSSAFAVYVTGPAWLSSFGGRALAVHAWLNDSKNFQNIEYERDNTIVSQCVACNCFVRLPRTECP